MGRQAHAQAGGVHACVCVAVVALPAAAAAATTHLPSGNFTSRSGETRRSSRGVGDIPDTASSPRRHRYRGAHASPPLIQPPARYRPLDLNFSTLQCSTVLLYDLGILYTVQLYTVLDQATV